jgi:hypothetical protein
MHVLIHEKFREAEKRIFSWQQPGTFQGVFFYFRIFYKPFEVNYLGNQNSKVEISIEESGAPGSPGSTS